MLHRISPDRPFADWGKSRLVLGWEERPALQETIEKAAGKWLKQYNREQKDAEAERRREERLSVVEKPKRLTEKAAANKYMVEAYNAASSNGERTVTARQIYYQIRPLILAVTGKREFKDTYFITRLLPRFMQAHPELTARWRVYFAPRGEFTEPHSGRAIKVGTEAVAGYLRPQWSYSAIVAVEKGGIADMLRQEGLHNRRDIAILNTQGQPTEALLALIDALAVPVVVLHDFDRGGVTIGKNIEGTWRHRHAKSFKIIEAGLRLDHVERWNLQGEPISEKNRRSVSDGRLRECGASAEEITFLQKHRVELDAATSDQLMELLDEALDALGIEKVVPDAGWLGGVYSSRIVAHIVAKERERLAKLLAAKEAEARRLVEAPDDIRERVAEWLDGHSFSSWEAAINSIADLDGLAFEQIEPGDET